MHWSLVEFFINSILFLCLLIILVGLFTFVVWIYDTIQTRHSWQEFEHRSQLNEKLLQENNVSRRNRGYSSDDFPPGSESS